VVVTAMGPYEETPPVRRAVGATGARRGFWAVPQVLRQPRARLLVKKGEGRDGDR
jgi:hypothetical protein